jgi:hypothetical protein
MMSKANRKKHDNAPAPEPMVEAPDVVTPAIEMPPATCANCKWSATDYRATSEPVPTAQHLNCRLNPPVFVGMRYAIETKNGMVDGFTYAKVRESDVCSYHEYKADK